MVSKVIVHVNQHNIKYNIKNEGNEKDVFTVKFKGKTYYGMRVYFEGFTKSVYRPHKPLSCGARLWMETQEPVTVMSAETTYYIVPTTGKVVVRETKYPID